MRRITAAKAFTIAAATALALSVTPMAKAQARECTNASLKGTFSDKDTGFLIAPPAFAGPFAGVSLQSYDGNGTFTATGTVSVNGTLIPVTTKGTYTVNPDCTGTYTAVISPLGLTSHASFVIDANGDELQIIVTDPDAVVTCVARRQFPAGDLRR